MEKLKIKSNRRILIQLTVLIIVIVAALRHKLALFHYICPICGVSSVYQFFASSTLWVVKLKSSLGIIIGVVIMTTIVFGPIVCGFICPFGTIQDLVAKLGKKMFKREFNNFVPKELDNKLKYLRYITLIGTFILTGISGIVLLEKVNPYHAFLGIFTKDISIVGFFILCLIIVLSLFIHRPWCKYLCPYGALLGIFNKFKVFRVVRKDSNCIGCKGCSKTCPMGIDVHLKEEVRDLRCISCLECVSDSICPIRETIAYTSKEIEELDDEKDEIALGLIENMYEVEYKIVNSGADEEVNEGEVDLDEE